MFVTPAFAQAAGAAPSMGAGDLLIQFAPIILLVLIFWRMARWAIALATSIAVSGALYHFGTKRTEHWVWVMPGAITATIVWFPATLAFGWYVSRIANYSRFYGSFGAGIATLVWLYITSFSALLGAELNGVLFRQRRDVESPSPDPEPASKAL